MVTIAVGNDLFSFSQHPIKDMLVSRYQNLVTSIEDEKEDISVSVVAKSD